MVLQMSIVNDTRIQNDCKRLCYAVDVRMH